ncbi:MAG: Histidine kinase [Burkholderiales bacterium]|jgi:PAS domain-containing protein/DNA-binding NarL/FixJ family response regulator|nr:Histidine kinase [Burkholderiales bacterium]
MRHISQNQLDDKIIYQVIDIIDNIIWWKDCNGFYLGCNEYVAEMFRLDSREQIIGKTDYDFFDKDEVEKLKNNDEIAMQTGSFIGEESFRFNGKREYFSTTKRRIVDANDNTVGILGSSKRITDIKEQMELEKKAALWEEDIKMRQILDLVPAHIYWKHKNEYYLGCNKRQSEFIGDREVLGLTEYDLLPKDEADKIHEHDQHVLEHGSFAGEEIGTDINGVTKTYFSSKRQLLNTNGEVVGLVGVTVDISDTKEKEQLKLENLQLEAQNKLNQVFLEKLATEAVAEQLRLENETYLVQKKEQAKFLAFIDKIQRDIQNYKVEALTEKIGIAPKISNSDKQIRLTKRELDILYYLSLNKSPKDIAKIISIIENKSISDSTINAIVNKKLYPKFKVFNVGQLIEKAILLNQIPFLLDTSGD